MCGSFVNLTYGSISTESKEDGYNISLSVDILKLSMQDEDGCKETIRNIGHIKRNCLASAFEHHFKKALDSKKDKFDLNLKPTVIHFQQDEIMYINAVHEQVCVIFSVVFKDSDDVVIAKVLMQEFREGLRVNQNSHMSISQKKNQSSSGYITFIFHQRHITTSERQQQTIDLMHTFRTYLNYHIKSSKAYIHGRIRSKTNQFIAKLKPDLSVIRRRFSSKASNSCRLVPMMEKLYIN
ncbi:hypothetical protein ACOME3_009209 [Neoechinorhynchus agilis]